MNRSRKLVVLMLPILVAFLFQATQYARAPVKYGYYVVYAKNADIALRPGSDLGPNGENLLQNSTDQEGLYNLTLGKWGPGYNVNYTDAFNVTNREVFAIRMIGFNFTAGSTGLQYLRMYVLNDTDDDGYGDAEVLAWDGSTTVLSSTSYVYLKAAPSYGSDGGTSRVKVSIAIDETGVTLTEYTGTLTMWFQSATF